MKVNQSIQAFNNSQPSLESPKSEVDERIEVEIPEDPNKIILKQVAKWNDYTQEQYQFQISFKYPVDLKFKFCVDYDDQFAVLGQETSKLFIIQVKSPYEGEHYNLIKNFENIARERLVQLEIERIPFTNHINVIK